VTAVPAVTTPPSTSSGSTGTSLDTYLGIVAVLAAVALLAGLVGLFMTRNRPLPLVAAPAGAGLPQTPPPSGGFYSTPAADPDHDWGSQTPGPPPPPPPPGPYEDEP
jgi:hypothetical protein